MFSDRFRLDHKRNAAVQVYEVLREHILSASLKPGTTMSRAQLCDYFQLSMSPVRNALAKLEDEQLVEVLPQHVTRVSAIDLASARAACMLRMSAELELARRIRQRPNPVLATRLALLVARQQALTPCSAAEFFQLDDQYHAALYRADQTHDLWPHVARFSNCLMRYLRTLDSGDPLWPAVLSTRADMARAIGAGDAVAARRCVRCIYTLLGVTLRGDGEQRPWQ